MHKNTVTTSETMAQPIIQRDKWDWHKQDWKRFHEWKKAHEVPHTFHARDLGNGTVIIFGRAVI